MIAAAAYVGSAIIFALLVPAKAQEWNYPKKQDIDGEKGTARVKVIVEGPKNMSTEMTTVQD